MPSRRWKHFACYVRSVFYCFIILFIYIRPIEQNRLWNYLRTLSNIKPQHKELGSLRPLKLWVSNPKFDFVLLKTVTQLVYYIPECVVHNTLWVRSEPILTIIIECTTVIKIFYIFTNVLRLNTHNNSAYTKCDSVRRQYKNC